MRLWLSKHSEVPLREQLARQVMFGVLSDDLNDLSIADGNILDYNTILNDAQATVLNDFLNKFHIDTDVSKIDACAVVNILGLQVCK